MSVGFVVLVFTSIVDTVLLPALGTKAVARHFERAGTADAAVGTKRTSAPANPRTTTPRTQRITVPCLAIGSGHRRQGAIVTPKGFEPTVMSSGFLLPVFTSIVDTEVGPVAGTMNGLAWVTKAVLPSGVIATPNGIGPTGMPSGFLVLVFTSIFDTVSPM